MVRENNEHLFMGHEICQVVMCLISSVASEIFITHEMDFQGLNKFFMVHENHLMEKS